MKTGFGSLTEMIGHRVRTTPGKTAFTFGGRSISFARLGSAIQGLARRLREVGLGPGGRGVIVMPNGPEFFESFYGVLRTGAAAIPLFPLSGPERIAAITRMSGARVVIVPSRTPEDLRTELEAALDHRVPVVRAGERSGSAERPDPTRPGLDDPALIQYTSGSTGNPKGVMISHRNLLTNMDQMIAGMKITEEDIFSSWLPVYHDMGLILMTLVPFHLAAELHLLPTDLKNPGRWLASITATRATFTAAPDFAYRLCLKHVPNLGDYDLSSLRVALNAAELVRPTTLRDFETAFGLRNVMVPGYGLAEATVGVAMWPPGTEVAVDRKGFASVGPPFPGVEIRIETDGRTAAPGRIGRIMVRSQANSLGYLDNPRENRRLFKADGFLATGDLGYLDRTGNLFIVGREKNIIIRAGETISPKEVEEIADQEPEIRFSAAVGIDRGRAEGEQVYLFAEIRAPEDLSTGTLAQISRRMTNALKSRLGFRPARVYLTRPRTIALTHNGKIRYAALKEQYLSGELRRAERLLFPDF